MICRVTRKAACDAAGPGETSADPLRFPMASKFYLGIDVGTGSARAGVFTPRGRMLGHATEPIKLWRPAPDFAEHSSDDIWAACGRAVRGALKAAAAKPGDIAGIGFDATCSLVVLDARDRPVSVSPTAGPGLRAGRAAQNVIVWMDHRAIPEAELINRTRHPVLRYVGGVISPEMQTPKLLWLKKNLPVTWKRAARFLDLPDFLTYRATGDDTRSLCTIVWMDHRAIPEAELINRTRHPVLRYVGGVISPEMQTPKLLWLKKNLPVTWKRAARFLD